MRKFFKVDDDSTRAYASGKTGGDSRTARNTMGGAGARDGSGSGGRSRKRTHLDPYGDLEAGSDEDNSSSRSGRGGSGKSDDAEVFEMQASSKGKGRSRDKLEVPGAGGRPSAESTTEFIIQRPCGGAMAGITRMTHVSVTVDEAREKSVRDMV